MQLMGDLANVTNGLRVPYKLGSMASDYVKASSSNAWLCFQDQSTWSQHHGQYFNL